MSTTSLSGFATLLNPTTQVVCAYATQPLTLEALPGNRWVMQGAFNVPENVECRLEAIGSVSGPTTLYVALFAPSKVEGSEIQITSTEPAPARSRILTLLPNVVYQIGIKVHTDTPLPSSNATSNTVHLVDP